MARVEDIKRDEVGNIVREARNTGRSEQAHLKNELRKRYPGIENLKIKRGGTVYNALDYLVEDTSSYA